VELSLEQQLAALDDAYQAATWRYQLNQEGVYSAKQFREWLAQQPAEYHEWYTEQARKSREFLQGAAASDAERVYERRKQELIWTDAGVLWAISVVEQRTTFPYNTDLAIFVNQVAEYRSASF
jgi:hypothetical protein